MKKILATIILLVCSLSLSAQKTVHSFKEALQKEDGCPVNIKKATVLANSYAINVVSDGETCCFVRGVNLIQGDVISFKGELPATRSIFPTIHCKEYKLISSGALLPEITYEDVNAVGIPDHLSAAVAIKATGIVTFVAGRVFLYTPDHSGPVPPIRTEVLGSPSLLLTLDNLNGKMVQINGFLLDKQECGISVATLLATELIEAPESRMRTIGGLNQLGTGESSRIMATVIASDENGFEVCDFSGSMRLNSIPGVETHPGQRVALSLRKDETGGDPIVTGARFLPGRSFTDTLVLRYKLEQNAYCRGPWTPIEGGYTLQAVPFDGESPLRLNWTDSKAASPLTYYTDNTLPVNRNQLDLWRLKVPKGVYDISYFPEAGALVFHASDVPYEDEHAYPGELVEESEAIPAQLLSDKPLFRGGSANDFSAWVNAQLRYPRQAMDANIQGRVTIQFTITSTGQLTNIRVLKSVHPLLDAEAVRVVSLSPDWTPGMHNGRPVSVTYSFPVIFQLNDKIQHKSDENSISGF